MEEIFVSHTIALLVKSRGFKKSCIAYYYKDELIGASTDPLLGSFQPYTERNFTNERYCLAPTQEQVLEWIREKYKVNIYPSRYNKFYTGSPLPMIMWGYCFEKILSTRVQTVIRTHGVYNTSKEAIENGIIKFLKKKK